MADKRKNFDDKIEVLTKKKNNNCIIIFQSRYNSIIADMKRISADGAKDRSDYWKKNRYDLRSIAGTEKLYKLNTDLAFLVQTELFDVIHTTHIQLGHGGRNVLENALAKHFANITREIIMEYLSLCEQCQLKKNKTRKHLVVKPIISDNFNSRCQVDLIDMQSQADGNFRFIMVYQDHCTKFVQIRPLTTKRAEEVAHNLVDIFCIFAAPHVLQTDNGREFENALIKEVLELWPGCKLVHGKPRHSQSQGSVERANKDVQDKLKCWMGDNNTTKWSEGLRFVQFAKNCCLHSGIGRSPYKALFGSEPRVGLSTTNLSKDVIEKINTEDDLEKALTKSVDYKFDHMAKADLEEQEANGDQDNNHSSIAFDTSNIGDDTTEKATCITCEKSCSKAHTCQVCQQPCHAIRGLVRKFPDQQELNN